MAVIAKRAKIDGASRDSPHQVSLSSILDDPRLPSPPALVLQIIDKASKPDCTPDDILALLSKDSGLCCQVLKTVNSGHYGLSRPVGSLKQAVLRLGVHPLRSLVLSLALPAIGVKDKDDLLVKYWQESVAGSIIAHELALFLHRKEPEDEQVAGLLRDVGILVLRQAFPVEYQDLWSRCAQDCSNKQCAEEQAAFGVDHAEISAGLLNSWKLPPEIYLPIRYHHDPRAFENGSSQSLDRAWLLCFAGKVAMLNYQSPNMVTELLQIAKEHFGMDQNALIKFLGSVLPLIKGFAGLLKVDVDSVPNYADIIATGCQELIRLSVDNPPLKREALHGAGLKERHGQAPADNRAPLAETRSVQHAKVATMPEFDISCMREVGDTGSRLDGYELKEILGRGGMGVVFKGYDPFLDRFVAIKMMNPKHLVQAEARERFKREARAVAAIQHENVVAIHAVGEAHGFPYLVMEYVPGHNLENRIDREGALPLADVIDYGQQIASGLNAAHARRVIHRDIKPANILLGREKGTLKITDFGLARVVDETRISHDSMLIGTPLFMAPEQFSGIGVDHRSDLFSLGSLLYTLCAGKPPFAGETVLAIMRQVCGSVPAPLRSLRPDVPTWLVDVIAKLIAKSPSARYQTAAEVVQCFARQCG